MLGAIPVEFLVKDTRKILNWTLGIAAVAAVIAALIGYAIARSIGGPLKLMERLMQRGAEGDLQVRTNFKSRDEIGMLGAGFNEMMERITSLVKQTNQSAADVLHTAGELTERPRKQRFPRGRSRLPRKRLRRVPQAWRWNQRKGTN